MASGGTDMDTESTAGPSGIKRKRPIVDSDTSSTGTTETEQVQLTKTVVIPPMPKSKRDASKALHFTTSLIGQARMVEVNKEFFVEVKLDRFDRFCRFIGATLRDAYNVRAIHPYSPLTLDEFVLMSKFFVCMRIYSITDKMKLTDAKTTGRVVLNKELLMPLPLARFVNGIGIVNALVHKMLVYPCLPEFTAATSIDAKVTPAVITKWKRWIRSLERNNICKLDVIVSDSTGSYWWLLDTRKPTHKTLETGRDDNSALVMSPFAEGSPLDARMAAFARRGNVGRFRFLDQPKLKDGSYRYWTPVYESFSDEYLDLDYTFRSWILKGSV